MNESKQNLKEQKKEERVDRKWGVNEGWEWVKVKEKRE